MRNNITMGCDDVQLFIICNSFSTIIWCYEASRQHAKPMPTIFHFSKHGLNFLIIKENLKAVSFSPEALLFFFLPYVT